MRDRLMRLGGQIRRKRNWPLAVGLAGVLLLLLIAIVGPYLAPSDPLKINVIMRAQGGGWVSAPYPPSALYPLGSDRWGRDILSGLLAGGRYTLLFSGLSVGLGLVIAIPLGLLAGWLGRTASAITQALSAGTGAIPQLLGAGLLLQRIQAEALSWSLTHQVLASASVLAIFTAPRLAELIRHLTLQLRQEPFVEAATASGAVTGRILFRHLLPNLAQPLTTAILLEYAAILRMLVVLGLFDIWVSPAAAYELGSAGPVPVLAFPKIPEWASYTGFAYTSAVSSYWILLYPGLALTGSIMIIHLFAEGLRRHWQLPQGQA